jgi:hypothetical protein
MRIRKLTALFVATAVIGTALPAGVLAAEQTEPAPQRVVISEVQAGSTVSTNQEFVELFNQTDLPIDVTGWRLEYKSATGTAWTTKATLAGHIEPLSFYLAATAGYIEANGTIGAGLAAAGGHVRLVHPGLGEGPDQILDLLGWGTADSAEGGQASLVAEPGQSIQRCLIENLFLDTDNNANDFRPYAGITLNSGVACAPEDDPPAPGNTCAGLLISEVLPNPLGADGGNEFIEIHNPTGMDITLGGCSLQTTGSTKRYPFGADVLEPGAYHTLYASETGLILPNGAGGTIYLLASDASEAYVVTYPPDMPDDVAWAWFGNSDWQITYLPSPGSANRAQPLKPCSAGQERNEDTGQCRNTVVAAGTTPAACPAGQERNPATNRCRSITAAATPTLTPCKPGQERNPETNRCRSVVVAGATLKPCASGQERNPETNRCRKIAGASTTSPVAVQDVTATTKSDMVGWWFAGIIGVSALGYAAYEWRQEITQTAVKLRCKLTSLQPKK